MKKILKIDMFTLFMIIGLSLSFFALLTMSVLIERLNGIEREQVNNQKKDFTYSAIVEYRSGDELKREYANLGNDEKRPFAMKVKEQFLSELQAYMQRITKEKPVVFYAPRGDDIVNCTNLMAFDDAVSYEIFYAGCEWFRPLQSGKFQISGRNSAVAFVSDNVKNALSLHLEDELKIGFDFYTVEGFLSETTRLLDDEVVVYYSPKTEFANEAVMDLFSDSGVKWLFNIGTEDEETYQSVLAELTEIFQNNKLQIVLKDNVDYSFAEDKKTETQYQIVLMCLVFVCHLAAGLMFSFLWSLHKKKDWAICYTFGMNRLDILKKLTPEITGITIISFGLGILIELVYIWFTKEILTMRIAAALCYGLASFVILISVILLLNMFMIGRTRPVSLIRGDQ